mmetsp:Transcript_19878/g.18893  ORF Transcript_19878/g.18893 Transcript_19878/m.18893 type:complete len:116 (-) Transcript_19878:48-395(-)
MRGNYKYAPLKMIISKMKNTPQGKELQFIDGEYACYQQEHLEIEGLTKGQYFVFFQAEWDPTHKVRRLLFNLYAPDPVELKRMNSKAFPLMPFARMEMFLNDRINKGESYIRPQV